MPATKLPLRQLGEKEIAVFIPGAINGTYTLCNKRKRAMTVIGVIGLQNVRTSSTTSGIVNFQNAGSNISGLSSLSFSQTVLGDQNGSGGNTIAAGAAFTMVISGMTGVADIAFTYTYTE